MRHILTSLAKMPRVKGKDCQDFSKNPSSGASELELEELSSTASFAHLVVADHDIVAITMNFMSSYHHHGTVLPNMTVRPQT